MAKAIRASDLPHHKARIDHEKKRAKLHATFEGKTFEELDAADKDALLKAVAIQLGLIKAS